MSSRGASGHVTFVTLAFKASLVCSDAPGAAAAPRRRSSPRRRPPPLPWRGAPGGRVSPRPLQPQRDGSVGGGGPGLGEGGLCEAGGVPVPRRLSPLLRLHLLAHRGPSVSAGARSVRGRRGGQPPLFPRLLGALWEYRDRQNAAL